MKRILIATALMLSASVAFADNAPAPDYSRDAILKVLHDSDVKSAPFKLNIGSVDINTRTTRFHLNYLPFLASIPYAGPHGASQLPNPFVLTGTEYAWRPGQYKAMPDEWYNDSDYKREYNRVAKMLRKQKIVVKTE